MERPRADLEVEGLLQEAPLRPKEYGQLKCLPL
jgi:hypothetical protein